LGCLEEGPGKKGEEGGERKTRDFWATFRGVNHSRTERKELLIKRRRPSSTLLRGKGEGEKKEKERKGE